MKTEIRDVDADYSPALAARFARLLAPLTRVWFRYELRGMEHLPERPCMIAGNHSGIGIADAVCLMGARDRFPAGRRLVGMMHDLFVRAPLMGHVSRAFGAVRAHPAAARQALARGYDLVVFPGGGLDSCRPFHHADRVVFGAHRGYVRIALEAEVPIVPLVTRGSHASYLLLPWIGDAIGGWLRRAGLSRDERLPVPFAVLPALATLVLWLSGLLPLWPLLLAVLVLLVPNPVHVTSELLPAIDVASATRHIGDPTERIEAAHRLVHGALQAALVHHAIRPKPHARRGSKDRHTRPRSSPTPTLT